MTMYLPNTAVRSSQSDPVEFLDVSRMADQGDRETKTSAERRESTTVQLSQQDRIDITRSARDYITKLVQSHSGDSEDVRSIIHALHDQIVVTRRHRAR